MGADGCRKQTRGRRGCESVGLGAKASGLADVRSEPCVVEWPVVVLVCGLWAPGVVRVDEYTG